MRTLNLPQGTPEWAAHRAESRNASDAPAMMGISPYVTRAELIRQRATGISREVDAATQARFDRGHEVEPALVALAEEIIGDEFFPQVGESDDGYLSASFDGVNYAGTIICEVKQSNTEKIACIGRQEIPPQDYWQIVQQFAVCDTATKCVYVCGDGTPEGSHSLEILRAQIEADIPKLRAGWRQFDADVAAYRPEPAKAEVVAAPVEGFGALSLRVEGRVLASNLDDFRRGAATFLARLPKAADLQTDQDFADAEAAVKACTEAETRIRAAQDAALAQMADVDAVMRAADTIAETIRAARLALDKCVKAEKENRRAEAIRAGVDAVREHYIAINATLAGFELDAPASLAADIGAAIKGLKSLDSIRAKIDGAVAQKKIAASQEADRRRLCIAELPKPGEIGASLIPDAATLVASKSPDDLRNLIAARVAEHEAKVRKQAEDAAERERERIREEERQRAANEAAAAITANDPPVAETARAPAVTASPAPIPHGAATPQTGGARKPVGARIKLGEICSRIAPLSITAQGLAELGFQPVGSEGAAKLYNESDFAGICNVLSARLQRAAQMQEAA